ncbi:hypothetical protein EVAR_20837_1 [Eumeta japonica]|uniref:Uncharacterized protein n=1 Tax=Eumeta variegata TaxID=151549 RepID=A0A4C1UDG0_EUMVA|nr:hypothetical protein EVAR_20837_1 [Eumeta japonica]
MKKRARSFADINHGRRKNSYKISSKLSDVSSRRHAAVCLLNKEAHLHTTHVGAPRPPPAPRAAAPLGDTDLPVLRRTTAVLELTIYHLRDGVAGRAAGRRPRAPPAGETLTHFNNITLERRERLFILGHDAPNRDLSEGTYTLRGR